MENGNKPRTLWAGIGLVLGTGLGTVACILLNTPIYYAGIGTCIGLLLGALIDSYN